MSYFKKRLDYKPTPSSCFSLAILLFAICFGWLLPPSYGQENGPVEWLQVIILGLSAVVAISALFQTHLSPSRRKLFALSSVGLLLAIARELSWGRVFYMNGAGQIPPLRVLWFGPYVYPFIAFVIVIAVGYFYLHGLHKELTNWLKMTPIPLFDVLIIIIAMLVADIVEHHSFGLFGVRTEVFEELGELISYAGVLSFMSNIVFSKRFR